MPSLLTPFLTRQRMQVIAPYLRGDVLDLACGFGKVIPLLKPGQGYLGIEGNRPFIKALSDLFPGHQFVVRDLDQDELNLDRPFDTILLIAVIEHLKHPGFLVAQLPHYLKKGGQLVMTTPSPLGDKIHRAGARIGLFSQQAVDEHETIFSHKMMVRLLESNGMEVIHYRRFLLGGNQLFICTTRIDEVHE